jgi:hypothetical protein
MAQVETLGSIPSTAKRKREEEKGREGAGKEKTNIR